MVERGIAQILPRAPTSYDRYDQQSARDILERSLNDYRRRLTALQAQTDSLGYGIPVTTYGATPSNSADDSERNSDAFNETALAAEGGTMIVPAGTFYVRRPTVLRSNTTVFLAPGAVMIVDSANWNEGNPGERFMFRNLNHEATELTDENIHLEGHGLINAFGMNAVHSWYMRYVDNSSVTGCTVYGGANFTAFLACRNTRTYGATARTVHNCGFDHWDGFGDADVIACKVYGARRQGIQFTGTGTALDARDSFNGKAIGNTIRDVTDPDTGFASGLIFNAVADGSTITRGFSSGNYMANIDLGLVMSGADGMHTSVCDTIEASATCAILLQAEDNDADRDPNNCRVIAPHLIDCNHTVGGVALIAVTGDGNRIEDVKITNSGAAPYDLIAWFSPLSSNCYISLTKETPSGASGRVDDDGTDNRIYEDYHPDNDRSEQNWNAYAPNLLRHPSTSDDNVVPRFNGTSGTLMQTSKVTIGDLGNIFAGDGTEAPDHVLRGADGTAFGRILRVGTGFSARWKDGINASSNYTIDRYDDSGVFIDSPLSIVRSTGIVTASGLASLTTLASTSSAQGASLIGVQDAGAFYTATTVEGVLAEIAADWTAYTPTIGAGSGTLTSVTPTGFYKRIGDLVAWRVRIQITTNGTGATNITCTLPFNGAQVNCASGVGIESGAGVPVFFRNASVGVLTMTNLLDGTYPGGDGTVIHATGTYMAA